MLLQSVIALAVAALSASSAVAVPTTTYEWATTDAPNIQVAPKNPGGVTVLRGLTRQDHRACHVRPVGNGGDDAPNIYAAAQKCNNGGKVVLANEYLIKTPLDLRGLKNVDIELTGTINFYDNVTYWQDKMFYWTFQNATSIWVLGGEDVNLYGKGVGTLNGLGQNWYDAYAANPLIYRAILLVVSGLNGGTISGINMRYSAQWYNLILNSQNVVYDSISISGGSVSKNLAKNTDGWDTYRSDNIVIQNSVINNGDDCVSFKPNSTNIVVQNLVCNGSHGISVGSLGQYKLNYDIVKNIYVYNISMSNASDGARIKVWPGVQSALSTDLQGGGGSGEVKNVTYDTFYNFKNDYVIELTQCYGQSNTTLCNLFPSSLTISDVYFKNFWGSASGKLTKGVVGSLICSTPSVCNNIYASNITISPNSGFTKDNWRCINVDKSKLAINCVDGI
ncbi:polygalacturonase [Zopfochytrium polystomum]|nr:polygalacturonase [Zopfochytrium polystomum]